MATAKKNKSGEHPAITSIRASGTQKVKVAVSDIDGDGVVIATAGQFD